MSAPKKIDSDYLILDVKKGRKKLARRTRAMERIEVLIRATIDRPYGDDDGTSIEFNCTVHSVEEVAK